MALSLALLNSEVWQLGTKCGKIQVKLNSIYCKLLGVTTKTQTDAVYYELGLIDHQIRAEAPTLKFRNHIIGLPDSRLVKQLYSTLKTLPTPGGRRNSNVVQSLMEPLAVRAGWPIF